MAPARLGQSVMVRNLPHSRTSSNKRQLVKTVCKMVPQEATKSMQPDNGGVAFPV